MSSGINLAGVINEFYNPKGNQPPPAAAQPEQVAKELRNALGVLISKGNSATNQNRATFVAKLAAFKALQINVGRREAWTPPGLNKYGNNGFPKVKGRLGLIGQAISERAEQAKKSIAALDPLRERRLKEELANATRRGQTNRASQIEAELAAIEKQRAQAAANRAAQEAAKKAASETAAADKKAKAEQKEALRKVIKDAMMALNTKASNATVNNRAAYVRAISNYKNAGYNVTMANRNLGVNRYSTTTGMPRTKTTTTTTTTKTYANHHEYVRNMREKLRKNPSQQRRLLEDALANLSKRLYTVSDNKRALEMIDNYRRLSSNSSYTANLNRRAERRKAAKKNEKKNENKKGGWSGGGQQIIFGQPPAAGGAAAAPVFVPGPAGAAPMMIPGPAGAAPVIVPGGGGGAGPSISVAPTIRVNVPQPAAQAAAQMLPSSERSALNNAGGYRRAASLVQNAGGPESVSRALNALQRSNGNVSKAMANSGLPKNVFTNVNKLGGPVTARRALTAVKKVSRKFEGPAKVRRALAVAPKKARRVLAVAPLRKSKSKKKYVSSACACGKTSQANKLRTVVSQLRRKNLEKNFLKCLLP